MSLATPVNKSISDHAKILLKEIKDMKIDLRIKCQFQGQFDNV